jgi:hypothetical protein
MDGWIDDGWMGWGDPRYMTPPDCVSPTAIVFFLLA